MSDKKFSKLFQIRGIAGDRFGILQHSHLNSLSACAKLLPPDTHMYVYVSGGKKWRTKWMPSFFKQKILARIKPFKLIPKRENLENNISILFRFFVHNILLHCPSIVNPTFPCNSFLYTNKTIIFRSNYYTLFCFALLSLTQQNSDRITT